MKLDDLRISIKVVLPTVILAVVALVCTGVGYWQEQQVQRAARTLVEQRSPAEVMSARFNRRISVMGYAAYQSYAEGSLTGQSQAALRHVAAIDTAYGESRDSLNHMRQLDPDTAPAASVFQTRVDHVYALARRGAGAAVAHRTVEARERLAEMDVAAARLSLDAKAWGDAYHNQTARMVQSASRRARIGRILSLSLALGSAAAGTFFALWIGASRIPRPIGRLAKTMDALSAGQLDVPLFGVDRGDEIGAMARSVRVFRDNAAALRTAQAADIAKSAFLANMSHEIRTPLNGVLGMAQVMEADELSPVQRERMRVIRDSGEALLAVLNDILDLSKMEAGMLELHNAPFDLVRMLAATCATFEGAASAKGVELSFESDISAAGAWNGDAMRLRQVVSNMVSNALKFTESGWVRVTARQGAGMLVISVHDSGIGIDAANLPKLFAKFTQADHTTTRRYGGTGLGLSISRDLIHLMGGEITAASNPGVGSVFTVQLELDKLAASTLAFDDPPPAQTPAMVDDGRSLRILAAEDNITNQMVLRAVLQQIGADVTMVDNGQEAVNAYAAGAFDLVLMDIQMPEMNGIEATQAIRALEAVGGVRPTPIIALSANVMAHQLEAYAEVGMQGYVAKPIEVTKLFAAISAVIQQAEEPLAAAA